MWQVQQICQKTCALRGMEVGALGKIEEGGRVFLKVWDFSFVNKIKGRIQSSNPKLTKNIFFLLVSFKMVFLSPVCLKI